MLYALTLLTIGFLLLNFYLAEWDILHPTVVFSAMFTIYEIVCCISAAEFQLSIGFATVLVLTIGFSTMTLVHLALRFWNKKGKKKDFEVPYLKIWKGWYVFAILVELVTIYYFIVYLKSIAAAWGSGGESLSSMIGLYDTMTKFWTEEFAKLNVTIPMVYRIGNPTTFAIGYICLYILVNNFVVKRKIEILPAICVALMCVLIILNGSRSPLLRVFTMAFMLLYLLSYRKNGPMKISISLIRKLTIAAIVFVAAMILLLQLMGRDASNIGLKTYLFIYLGAPIANLDQFIKTHDIAWIGKLSAYFGEYTFSAIYRYGAKLMHFTLPNSEVLTKFVFSTTRVEIGNVYTMYQYLIYDFGVIGMIPFVALMFCYYIPTYHKLFQVQTKRKLDFRLFVFAYLWNDLIMSPFSCRFYETTLDAPFLKLVLFAWVLDWIVVEHQIYFGNDTYFISWN